MSSDKKPARRRYENKNPVVSVRISREKARQFDEITEEMELSKKDWLEKQIEGSKQEVDRVREKAHKDGFEEAREIFAVMVPCGTCGKELVLRNDVDQDGASDRVFELLDGLSIGWTGRPANTDYDWEYECEDCLSEPTF